MPILIDGHNLIGAGVFDDIRLSDEDDEAKLVARLRVWRSRYQGKFTVVFDRGIPGGIDHRMGGGGVEVVFAADPGQADDLIRRRLRRGKPGLVLVSNDDALVREAEALGVETWRGAEFVRRFTLQESDGEEAGTEADVQLSEAEVEEWLALFGAKKREEQRRRELRRRKRDGTKQRRPSRTDRPRKRSASRKNKPPSSDGV